MLESFKNTIRKDPGILLYTYSVTMGPGRKANKTKF
jgi:hypothetical protein